MSRSKARVFVIGDIHGAHKALLQCLLRADFDYHKDRLIVLGDVCDGYPDVKQSVSELLKIKHCDYIIGNHDLWALEWATKRVSQEIWLNQGGRNTVISYGGAPVPKAHIEFFQKAHPWFEFEDKLFVHGGIDPSKAVNIQDVSYLAWDRALIERAWQKSQKKPDHRFSKYQEIYVGHTPTQWFAGKLQTQGLTPQQATDEGCKPLFLCNVVMLDTGAGWSGKLTIMDIHSHEYWQSDLTSGLYGFRGRERG
jgi:serine/threonine protein phosphatase 1